MTRLALTVAPLLLLLAACGDKQPATVNESVSDSGLEQENVVAGDVTAIDAATADDAADGKRHGPARVRRRRRRQQQHRQQFERQRSLTASGRGPPPCAPEG